MMENKEKIYYSALVNEAEAYTAGGHTLTRFEMLKIMIGWHDEINRDHLDMVEQLYADGFVKE